MVEKLNKADEALKNEQSDVGVTPVMSAAFGKKTGIATFLLQHGGFKICTYSFCFKYCTPAIITLYIF